MALEKFLEAPIEVILYASRKMNKVKEAKVKSELSTDRANKVKT